MGLSYPPAAISSSVTHAQQIAEDRAINPKFYSHVQVRIFFYETRRYIKLIQVCPAKNPMTMQS